VRGSWSSEYRVGAIAMRAPSASRWAEKWADSVLRMSFGIVPDAIEKRVQASTGAATSRACQVTSAPSRLFGHGRGFADRFDAIHQHVVDREVALEQDVEGGVDAVLVVGLEQLLQLRVEIALPGPFFNAAGSLHDGLADAD
jgi:hypothetical protein